MKKKIVLAVVMAAVVLAAAFALHRPQAGTQPTPEPTRQAETNDAVPQSPRRSPPRRLNRSPRQLLSRSRQLPPSRPRSPQRKKHRC